MEKVRSGTRKTKWVKVAVKHGRLSKSDAARRRKVRTLQKWEDTGTRAAGTRAAACEGGSPSRSLAATSRVIQHSAAGDDRNRSDQSKLLVEGINHTHPFGLYRFTAIRWVYPEF
ncbi:hypothetical protein EYF80_039690 [Liparis tanakae]|uniref:Uncharacterized protein n=1 Tax=Liparis tanakae TaxID=230148 RepID=A0A4Z2GBJ1_9TELE|nr:hypothetical protein EYF80_039690 [Liparis tanakae]